jgi:N-acetyl-beta-hexosaminidase
MKNPKIIPLILFTCLFSKGIIAQCPIIPAPSSYLKFKDRFDFQNLIQTNFSLIPANIKAYFTTEMSVLFNLELKQMENIKPTISFLKVESAIHKDWYEIDVKTDHILISFSSDASCFYAINSFLQLIEKKGTETYIQNCKITDYPKFEWRGLHLDVSRHFFSVEEVKKYIDLMAFYKFNTFHWHLTDDQGWRIEIKKYPKLTETGAWRDSTVNNHYTTIPRTYSSEIYGGFYTQEQIREVVKYAESKYINIVPEIEMPGHARAALAAL